MIKQNFNQNWKFRRGLDNPMMSAFVGPAGDRVEVCLPHDAMISSERRAENSIEEGIGYYTPENVEYEKNYPAPVEDAGKVTYMEFEGVYGNAVLEINGQVVKRHRFGFTGFTAKISDYLKYGENNVIKMSALNEIHPNGRFYTGTGIYRTVNLMISDAFHIIPDGVRLTTLQADEEMAAVEIAVTVRNENSGHRKGTLKTTLSNGVESVVINTVINLMSSDEQVVRQRVYVRNPALWSVENPNLYHYEATLEDESGILDAECGTFGIRMVTLDPVHGLMVNGKSIKLRGGCVHSDNGPIGAVSVWDAENRRMKMMKEAGYNAIRTAHNPVSRAFLDACDKNGLLVMEEFIDAWTHPKPTFDYSLWMTDCWEQDIEDMVRVAYNHPSVIMYSIGNEIPDIGTDLSARWGRKYMEKLKSIDSTRLVTNGVNVMMANLDKIGAIAKEMGIGDLQAGEINNMMASVGQIMGQLVTHPISMNAIRESCDMLDVVGYNYAAHMYEMQHQTMPHRIFLGSETNPCELDVNWEIVERNSYVIGDFAWTAWDYIGEPGIGRIEEKQEGFNVYSPYPWMLAYCGDFDITGYRRPVSYWREIIWGGRNHKPYIAVQRPENIGKELYFSQWSWTDSISSWTFPGFEGEKTVVEVYSDCEEVELFCNGKSLGRKMNNTEKKKCYVSWDVEYQPGTLEAVGFLDGKESGRALLRTAEDAILTVKADKTGLKAGSEELAYVEIEYRTKEDDLDMFTDHRITLEAAGNIEIAGSGTANPRTEERYVDLEHQIYEGRMLAVVRAKGVAGEGSLKITDEIGSVRVIQYQVL